MAELTVHFEVVPGTDLNAAALELQRAIVNVQGVESADTKAQRFQSVSVQEVLTVIQFTTSFVENTAELLAAIAALHEAWKKVREIFPGLNVPLVEVGLKHVPIDEVTAEQVKEIASDQ